VLTNKFSLELTHSIFTLFKLCNTARLSQQQLSSFWLLYISIFVTDMLLCTAVLWRSIYKL